MEANGSCSQERQVVSSFWQIVILTGHMVFITLSLGKVKSIGVSNFSQTKLEEILPTAEIIPAVDQVANVYLSTLFDVTDRVCVASPVGAPCIQSATQAP